jgi:protein-S-isoprenylcysteine O-methyltransferase Ste14
MEILFDYLQISYLAILVIIVLIRVLYLLLIRHINPFVLGRGKRKKTAYRVIEILFSTIIALWSAEILIHSLQINIQILPSFFYVKIFDFLPAKIAGTILIPIGLFLFAWAQISFGDSWRVGIDNDQPGSLITKGAFSFSRNPIFLAIDLYTIGTFLINSTKIFLFTGLFIGLVIHYQIINEEKHLKKAYGQIYLDYQSNVRRYLTFRGLSRNDS